MPLYLIQPDATAIKSGGVRHEPGSTIELTQKHAQPLLDKGDIEPAEPVEPGDGEDGKASKGGKPKGGK